MQFYASFSNTVFDIDICTMIELTPQPSDFIKVFSHYFAA